MKTTNSPREAGFTLVILVMVIAVMSIMMGVAVQTVSFQMKREREAELIFRGRQYVEAVRIFKAKYGRNPMRMKEIWEADPKVIRKKWKDPITNSDSWGIVFMGQERQVGGRKIPGLDGGTPLPTGTAGSGAARPGGQRNRSGLPDGVRRNEEGELIGPIVGVHSTSCDDSIKIYEGRTSYCEWRFFLEPDQQRRGRGGQPGGGGPGGGGPGGGGPGGGGPGGGPGGGTGGGYHGGDPPRDAGKTPNPYPTGTPRR